ncbi:MAG TPA: glycosyltransferase family 2 protein [Burkholderiales bacterium]|nr:glycosyltransferase family 2 protein [Burkholderiales bacterium]
MSAQTVPAHRYTISFVVPAFNEERVLGSFVEQLMAEIALARFADYEVILVNDGSSDRTGEIMDQASSRHPKVRVLHNATNLRFGNSYKRGLGESRFEYVMLLCGDGGLPAASLPAIFDQIGRADIVVPWMTNLRRIKSFPRYLLSRGYTAILNTLFGLRLRYYNGLPVHRRDLLQKIAIKSGGFGFQAEILIKLLRSGCTFVEVGVEGAEVKQHSVAMRPRNWVSVAATIARLIVELLSFEPVPAELIARRPAGAMREQSHEEEEALRPR